MHRNISGNLIPRVDRHGWLGAFCLAAILLTGCRTPQKQSESFTFYPPAPDQPRIQYLTSFSSESGLGEPSKLSQFVLGGQRIIRPIWKPYGITSVPGKLFICDTEPANISTVDLEKKTLRYLRPAGSAAMRLPINVAVDEGGLRYVSDTSRREVLIYDQEGNLKTTLGRGQDMKPCGLAVAGGKLYVTDLSNHCVKVYSTGSLKEVLRVPQEPVTEESRLRSPTNIAVDSDGTMYVSDTGGFVVQVYDAQGRYLRSIGEMGVSPGKFALPKGIALSRDGLVYVVDAAANVAQVFDREGRILMYFGQPDTTGSLYLPAGLRVDYDNIRFFRQYVAPGYDLDHLIYITSQAGDRKVNVYGFLKKK